MKLFWKFYSFVFYIIVLNNALQLLNKDSLIEIYYHTTIVFSPWHIIPYLLNILNVIINAIVCIFVLAYAFDLKTLPQAPLSLFYARLLSDSVGHSYEWQIILSGFSQSKFAGFLGVASLTIPILPSYLALWRITYKQK